ncbi:MAG: hypothetical protein KatS3mg013_1329 [Actinomycetota bacterium]|jgi:predicted enzyme related to lactoylglutathione lyase|nr:MAG: hypothetical protein KatS3mg013_1329 [Actinomycetota bacterium]
MDKVVHFEIPVDDAARAKGFYQAAFGWQIREFEMVGGGTYTTAQTVAIDERMMPTEPGAINGALTARTGATPHPVITIQVDQVDEALRRVETAGGVVVTPRTEVPGMGAFAYVVDTEGNTVGLWESHP